MKSKALVNNWRTNNNNNNNIKHLYSALSLESKGALQIEI